MIVLDASVAVKLYRDETESDLAHALFKKHGGEIAAPDIFAVEVAGALVREANITKERSAESAHKLTTFAKLLISPAIELRRSTADDMHRAARLAIDLGHPLKDCIYLELAIRLGHPLITADAQFAARARNIWPDTKVLAEFPRDH